MYIGVDARLYPADGIILNLQHSPACPTLPDPNIGIAIIHILKQPQTLNAIPLGLAELPGSHHRSEEVLSDQLRCKELPGVHFRNPAL